MLMTRGLVGSYRPTLAKIEGRLQNAELSFIRWQADGSRSDLDADGYRRELMAMKWVNESLVRELSGLSRQGSPAESAWFQLRENANVAEETQSLIDEGLASGRRHTEAIRVGLDLIAGQRTAELLDVQRIERAQSARFERRVSVLAAVLIGPGLVAAVFSATPETLSHCVAARLALMLALMVVAGLVGWLMLGRPGGSNDDAAPPAPRRGSG